MSILSLHGEEGESMELLHDPQSASPRRGGLGTRLRTIHRTAVSGIRVSTSGSHTLTAAETLALDSTDYVGAFLFHGNSFSKYLFDDGYVTYTSSTPSMYFYLRDHQGNNRTVAKFTTLSYENPSLSQTTYYYPYGGVFGDKGSYPDSQPYKYNGKELDRMHGLDWYDYGARQYDPAIARFTSMDPLAEKYYHISPYAYCAGNPVNYVDPDGREIWIDYKDQSIRYESGNLYNSDGSDYTGKVRGYLKQTYKALGKLSETPTGRNMISQLQLSNNVFTVADPSKKGNLQKSNNHFQPKVIKGSYGNISEVREVGNINDDMYFRGGSGGTIFWLKNFEGGVDTSGAADRPSYIGLGHEMAHACDSDRGLLCPPSYTNSDGTNYSFDYDGLSINEWRACYIENLIRQEHGIPHRAYYGLDKSSGKPVGTGPKLIDENGIPINYIW